MPRVVVERTKDRPRVPGSRLAAIRPHPKIALLGLETIFNRPMFPVLPDQAPEFLLVPRHVFSLPQGCCEKDQSLPEVALLRFPPGDCNPRCHARVVPRLFLLVLEHFPLFPLALRRSALIAQHVPRVVLIRLVRGHLDLPRRFQFLANPGTFLPGHSSDLGPSFSSRCRMPQ